MSRYFKFVATREAEEEWMFDEALKGRARFGWGPPGSDLKKISSKPKNKRTSEEKVVWKQAQFLLKRLEVGDRLIIQHKRPLRKFLIAEVTGNYHSTNTEEDFNHYVECELISKEYIPIESEVVSQSLRHHLSKRGRYYEIYDEGASEELNQIVEQIKLENSRIYKINKKTEKMDKDLESLEEVIIKDIRTRMVAKWPSFSFENFVAEVIENMPGVEVKLHKDSKKGWDLTIRILDPTDPSGQTILHDDVPVQCKNYEGKVTDFTPIDDLVRCVKNTESDLAYLFIMGELSSEFKNEFERRIQETNDELEKNVAWRIVDEEQMARMYINKISHTQR
ncbi:restriction endonuclease [Marinococcus luteus]|uniref:restriction endonuclease n=1 Tax=Marinococcus luteus TaxID=1122204 RepID=UPI002ACCA70F|nr:restriction endonuclease [Marinococcus luteus]MDZ5781886.1 restriction endonuclease [Marinococcus luteus]